MKQFFETNKVLLTGLLAAIGVVLQQFISSDEIDWKVIGFAALIAGLSFFAKEWRGQGVTILGIIGSVAGVLSDELGKEGGIDTSKLILFALVAVISAVAPPIKPASYEKTPTIAEANQEAQAIKEAEKTTTIKP